MTSDASEPPNLHHLFLFLSLSIQQHYTAVQRDCLCLTGRTNVPLSFKTGLQMWSRHLQEGRWGCGAMFRLFRSRETHCRKRKNTQKKDMGRGLVKKWWTFVCLQASSIVPIRITLFTSGDVACLAKWALINSFIIRILININTYACGFKSL